MTTLTLDHLSEPQRQALQGPAARPANRFHALAGQLATRADQAQAQGLLILSCGLRGFAAMARDLASDDFAAGGSPEIRVQREDGLIVDLPVVADEHDDVAFIGGFERLPDPSLGLAEGCDLDHVDLALRVAFQVPHGGVQCALRRLRQHYVAIGNLAQPSERSDVLPVHDGVEGKVDGVVLVWRQIDADALNHAATPVVVCEGALAAVAYAHRLQTSISANATRHEVRP